MFILLKLSIGLGTDFLGKAEDTPAFQGCICFIWRCSLGSCSLLLCHQLPVGCTSWKSGPCRLTLQKLHLATVWHPHKLDGMGPCTFPSTFGITVVTEFYFFILKINAYSELVYIFGDVFLAFFSCCSPSLPAAPVMAALCHGTRWGLIFSKYFYSTAVVVICCAMLCCNSQLTMRQLLTSRIGHWTLCFSSVKILQPAMLENEWAILCDREKAAFKACSDSESGEKTFKGNGYYNNF